MFHSKDLVLSIMVACRPEPGEVGGTMRLSVSWARQAGCRGRDGTRFSQLLLPPPPPKGEAAGAGWGAEGVSRQGRAGAPIRPSQAPAEAQPGLGLGRPCPGAVFSPGEGLTAIEGHREALVPNWGRLWHPEEVGDIWVVRSGRSAAHSSG